MKIVSHDFKTVGVALFVMVLVANPIAAYCASSWEYEHLAWLTFYFTLFYLGCGWLMRSRMIDGALIGVVLSILVHPTAVNGSRHDEQVLGAAVRFTVIGALAGSGWEVSARNDRPNN